MLPEDRQTETNRLSQRRSCRLALKRQCFCKALRHGVEFLDIHPREQVVVNIHGPLLKRHENEPRLAVPSCHGKATDKTPN